MRIKYLHHAAYASPDPERLAQHYTDVLGLELAAESRGTFYLRCNQEHHCLAIVPGKARRLHHLSFLLPDTRSVRAAADELQRRGIEVQTRVEDELGQGEAIRFRDPRGNGIELVAEVEQIGRTLPPAPVRPLSLQHVFLMTKDMEQSEAFYTDVLGFKMSDQVTGGDLKVRWLRCNPIHHTVALVLAPVEGVNHYAWEFADIGELKRMCDHLQGRGLGLVYGMGRHGVGNNLFAYYEDPDHNMHELLAEMELIYDDERRPHRDWVFEQAVNLWGILPEARFIERPPAED